MEENEVKEVKAIAEYKTAYESMCKEREELEQNLQSLIKEYNTLYAECQHSKTKLALARAEFLLKIIEFKESFSKETVQKSIAEFEDFMFPKDLENNKKEAE